MTQALLTILEAETKHISDESSVDASTAPGPDTQASAAKKTCSLLLSVHEETLRENAEAEQLLASPSSEQEQNCFSETPSNRGENALNYWRINKDHFPARASLARAKLSASQAEMLRFTKRNKPLMLK